MSTSVERLIMATQPEDLFGTNPDTAHHVYRDLVKLLHPDRDSSTSPALFARLTALWTEAERRLATGAYGKNPVVLRVDGAAFTLTGTSVQTELARTFETREGPLLKLALEPRDDDLIRAEAGALRTLHMERPELHAFFPELVSSVTVIEGGVSQHANILRLPEELYSLEDVTVLRGPIEPRDAAWIFRRLLKALGHAHRAELVHGAVIPRNVLILPDLHGLVLVDWCYSRPLGVPLRAVPPAFRDWYPSEALAHSASRPSIDISMAARCMMQLMGGNPRSWQLPVSVSQPLRTFFSSWHSAGPHQVQDAWALNVEFTELIDSLWPRRYRPFSMPPRNSDGGNIHG